MTLNDLNAKIGGFIDFLAILGCDTSLYYSQGGSTKLSLCDPDKEFEHLNFSYTTEPEPL